MKGGKPNEYGIFEEKDCNSILIYDGKTRNRRVILFWSFYKNKYYFAYRTFSFGYLPSIHKKNYDCIEETYQAVYNETKHQLEYELSFYSEEKQLSQMVRCALKKLENWKTTIKKENIMAKKDFSGGLDEFIQPSKPKKTEEKEVKEKSKTISLFAKIPASLKKKMDMYCVTHDMKKQEFFEAAIENYLSNE